VININSKQIKNTIRIIGQNKIMALLSMTPYYWSINLEKKQNLEKIDKLDIRVSNIEGKATIIAIVWSSILSIAGIITGIWIRR